MQNSFLLSLILFLFTLSTQAEQRCSSVWANTFKINTKDHLSWRNQFSITDDGKSELIQVTPTGTIGTWLEKTESAEKIEIRKVSMGTTERLTLETKNCKILSKTILRSTALTTITKNDFTDHDLSSLLVSHNKGLIYLWSPYMPLSLTGIKEVQEFQKISGVNVTYILDPHVSTQEALPFTAKYHLPIDATKHLESLELFYHGMSLHYPSAMFYQNGKITPSVVHGLNASSTYLRILAALRRGSFPPKAAPATANLKVVSRTIQPINSIALPNRMDYWHRPVLDTDWIGITVLSFGDDHPELFNIRDGREIKLPKAADPVPTQDALYLIVPTTRVVNSGRACFYEMSAILNAGSDASLVQPLFCDTSIKADYLFVGQLTQNAQDSTYRLVGHGSSSLHYRDFKITHRRGNLAPIVTPLGTNFINFCYSRVASLSLPMVSPNGLEIGGEDTAGVGTTKIFDVDSAHPTRCNMTLDLGIHTSKMAFDPTSKRVAFFAQSFRSLEMESLTRPSAGQYYKAYVLDRATDEVIPLTENNDQLQRHSYPAFLKNGDVIYQDIPTTSTGGYGEMVTVRIQ